MSSSALQSLVQYGSDSDGESDSEQKKPDTGVKGANASAPTTDRILSSTTHTLQAKQTVRDVVEEIDDEEKLLHLKPFDTRKAMQSMMRIVAAPCVPKQLDASSVAVDPYAKSIMYNLSAEQMYAPVAGPSNPSKVYSSTSARMMKNCVTGHFEPAHVGSFLFETQRRTFHVKGYAADPSANSTTNFVGSVEEAAKSGGSNIHEAKSTLVNRKKDRNADSSDVDGYNSPWADLQNQVKSSKPSEEDMRELEEFMMKRHKRRRNYGGAAKDAEKEAKELKDSSMLHIKNDTDYAGRSFMEPPRDVDANLRSEEPPAQCFLPKKQLHAWAGHAKGVTTIRWFPQTAHMLLSCGMDCKVKLWRVYDDRALIRSYTGHAQTVKDITFNRDGTRFLSCSYDRWAKLWDTETGQCIQKLQTPQQKMMNCLTFNPDADKQHLFVTGTADKKILCFDLNSGEVSQEYDRHMGAINSVTFIEQNRRFVSTSDDKTIRIWEWDIPVDFKYIADPAMHSMPAVTQSPDTKWLLMQSMDNKLNVFQCHANRYRVISKKKFTGHMVAGYGCKPDFSPDLSYVMSGDADGKVYIWDWKTTRQISRWKAHDKCCIQTIWHPHETSKVVSASWDGAIKLWD